MASKNITVAEAAKKLKVSERRVRVLCNEGRIKGASRLGTWVWQIPVPVVVTESPVNRSVPGKIKTKR